ncbi:unnamed protein product [Enterobius vermicularis]|uniref:Neur_chan_LBD domain-containing protein n=1 Tax=Enterobius vermicularis TaxID=51028 RepID=A0A0N4VMC1_ENTVE|nr:unnamed protein product [Enterobius vermicularis]
MRGYKSQKTVKIIRSLISIFISSFFVRKISGKNVLFAVQNWTDYNLTWDPEEYGNITSLRFPASRLWKPDVLLYNSVDSNFDSTYQVNILVSNDGSVTWIPPGIFKFSCKINIRWFPFDEQHCSMKSLTAGFIMNRTIKRYECCPEPYIDVTAHFWLRRRVLYYGFNLIMPCVLTTMMALLGFTLPPDAGEKITLQITVLLSICFFLSIVSDMSPATSEAVPLLGIFFSCCMIVVTASTVFTVYVLNLHFRTPETHEMGVITRTILLYWLPWLLRINRPGVKLTWQTLPPLFFWTKPETHSESLLRNIKEAETGSRSNSLNAGKKSFRCLSQFANGSSTQPVISFRNPHSIPSSSSIDIDDHATLLVLQRIYKELKTMTKRMVETDRDAEQANNWKFAAIVIDRLCLYLFTVFLIASTCGTLLSAPNSSDADNYNITAQGAFPIK